MSTVADILKSKSSSAIVSVRPEHSVFEALRLMADKGIGAVLVMAGKDVQGIFTERDYARKLVLQGRAIEGFGLMVAGKRYANMLLTGYSR